MLERINNPTLQTDETDFDRALRPRTLSDFIGQDHIKEQLDISIQAARLRSE
ncbi:MAG TPA: Holliday junction branch migration DNA helicase RuvB, partial [Candidatus Cloacimonas sp.]|nr:Holliday junction branch migration DNA helicase RuvB [Candidatus Cloacimonas sp.]